MNNTTLLRGKLVLVTFDDEATLPLEVRVRQIPVREYEAGFKLYTDEVALIAFLCAKPKEWALSLSPESYEEVIAIGREVNARGFFSFCLRRSEQEKTEQAQLFQVLSKMPPEVIQIAVAHSQQQSASPGSSQPVRPRRELE